MSAGCGFSDTPTSRSVMCTSSPLPLCMTYEPYVLSLTQVRDAKQAIESLLDSMKFSAQVEHLSVSPSVAAKLDHPASAPEIMEGLRLRGGSSTIACEYIAAGLSIKVTGTPEAIDNVRAALQDLEDSGNLGWLQV